jgi:septal ring factor EnvC (AmiA/AmiB activator)
MKCVKLLLLVAFVLFSAPAWSEDSYIDQALTELDNLEASLKELDTLITSLQRSLLSEQLLSLALSVQTESLRNQLQTDSELLTAQKESLSQAEAARKRLERSLKLSRLVNWIAVPVAVISIAILIIK